MNITINNGVRKYDEDIGRFTSVDPLWSKYIGWTPYHYCGNDPVSNVDPSGLADYYYHGDDENHSLMHLSDGVDDGMVYATSLNAVNASKTKDKDNPYDFEKLSSKSYGMPTYLPQITEGEYGLHSDINGLSEAGGVGDMGAYAINTHRNQTPNDNGNPTCTKEVKRANDAFNEIYDRAARIFLHDHPWGFDMPSNKGGDREAIRNGAYQYGILIYMNSVRFFNGNSSGKEDAVFSNDEIINILRPNNK